jgi:hypothetical protein
MVVSPSGAPRTRAASSARPLRNRQSVGPGPAIPARRWLSKWRPVKNTGRNTERRSLRTGKEQADGPADSSVRAPGSSQCAQHCATPKKGEPATERATERAVAPRGPARPGKPGTPKNAREAALAWSCLSPPCMQPRPRGPARPPTLALVRRSVLHRSTGPGGAGERVGSRVTSLARAILGCAKADVRNDGRGCPRRAPASSP